MTKVLITGGTGYIGSHVALAALAAGYDVAIFDNLDNSSSQVVHTIKELCGKDVFFHKGDIRSRADVINVFESAGPIQALVHCAGKKSVAEGQREPELYYEHNVSGSINLFNLAYEAGVRSMVFSSSATVYGVTTERGYTESDQPEPFNVYGRCKRIVELFLEDMCSSRSDLSACSLRYFNPIGADKSGALGESPTGKPENLAPNLAAVALGFKGSLKVFGGDYPTPDGTAMRDYIHVSDLSDGHIKALDHLAGIVGHMAVNLGSGEPHSVLKMIDAYGRASNQSLAFEIEDRRPGDLSHYFADSSLAMELFEWRASKTIDEMCDDDWRWRCTNGSPQLHPENS